MVDKQKTVVLVIDGELAGQRIDRALASLPEVASRSQAARLLQQGLVRLSGRVLKPSYLTQMGERIDVAIPEIESKVLLPYEFPLTIVFEDKDVLVVDKPAGLVVHPACGHSQDTLVNALLHYTKDLSMGFNETRPGLVHRLDKGTSGLLVIAKHDEAQRSISSQFQKKTTHRLYRAIVFGHLKNDHGTIESFLRRHPEDRKRSASVLATPEGETPSGKLAITHYRVLEEHRAGLSLIELRLETGRTHQIRVHLSEFGHPIVGDDVYGSTRRLKSVNSKPLRQFITHMERFALHAAELGFVHPRLKKFITLRSPWPEDLCGLVDQCQFTHFLRSHKIEFHEP